MDTVGTEEAALVGRKIFSLGGSRQAAVKEREEFCTYIKAYRLNMFRLAKSILHNDSDAEDATSEAILKAYKNLDNLKSYASFKPWIMKIVVNEAYNLARQRQKVLYLQEMEFSQESTSDDSAELWSVVNTLEEEFRIITVLYYYEDMSIKEISQTLGLPIGTVKSRLGRARQKLKALLTEEGGRK